MATILIPSGTTTEISDDIDIPDYSGVPLMLFTDDGSPVVYGIRFSIQRKAENGAYQSIATVEYGKVELKWDVNLLILSTPGTYRIIRPDITEYGQSVGVQLG